MAGHVRRSTAAALAGFLFVVAAPPALGCAYHGQPSFDLFGIQPDVLKVAVAVREARQSGILPPATDDRVARRLVGYKRTARNMRALKAQWAAHRRDDPQPLAFSLMVVEPALWAHLSFDGYRDDLVIHTAKPTPDEPILFLAEAALKPMASGELSPDEAIEMGLIRIVGDDDGRVSELILLAGL